MRAVLQRVSRASVAVDGAIVSSINTGLLILLGVEAGDTDREMAQLLDKLVGMRLFPDDGGNMNRSCEEVGGEYLVVSQFTLCADTKRGKRPGFEPAARPEVAEPLYQKFCAELARRSGRKVGQGVFGAMMEVELVNSGPVTILLHYPPQA
jgi:D-tyrosyl-tRNA(Tyr) deacylase